MSRFIIRFLPFWIFLIFFKFGGGLHYSLLSPLGERFLPLWLVGILMGGGSLVQLFLDVPAGRLLDRYGYVKLLKLTTTIFLVAVLCFAFGLTTTTYLLSILISPFGWLFFGPGVDAYVLSHAPKEHAGGFISLRDVSGSIGIVLSSAALPFVLLFSPQAIGITLCALLVLALVMLSFSPRDTRSVHEEVKLPTHHHYVRRNPLFTTIKVIRRLNPASTMLLILNLTGATFYGVIWFTVPLVIASQVVGSELLGIGLGIFDLSVVTLGFLIGNLADRANKRTLVFFGLLIFSVAAALTGMNFGWFFILFGFLATAGDELAGISLWSWLHALDREHDSDGLVSGVITLFSDLGWALGPILAGLAYGLIGPTWTIALGALPIFMAWLAYQALLPHHTPFFHLPGSVPRFPHRPRHRRS